MVGVIQLHLLHTLTISLCLASNFDSFTNQSGVITGYLTPSSSKKVTSLSCAAACLVSISWCHGYYFDSIGSGCELYSKVCLVQNGDREVFVRELHNLTRTNLALGKPANMSSQLLIYVASLGNDGVYYRDADTIDYGGDLTLFFHTLEEQDPWWRVDLEDDYCVSAVYFLNRGYGSYERTKDVVITVAEALTDIEDNGDNVCGRIIGEAERWDNLVTCTQPLIGRYIQLKCMALTYFHLYEVEVHGY